MENVVAAYDGLLDLEMTNRIDHFNVRIGHGRNRKTHRFNREKARPLH